MGLRFPSDIEAWQHWHERRHRLRRLKARATGAGRPPGEPSWHLASSSETPKIIIALDTPNPTSVASLLGPWRSSPGAGVAIVAPFALAPLVGDTFTDRPVTADAVDDLVAGARVAVGAGHYLPVGGAVCRAARRHELPFVMVQHGLLTPLAPPLPAGAHLLAWSEADAEFWRSGRSDVTTEVVGSQLFASAAARPCLTSAADAPPVYLGQLHAAELSRAGLARAADRFCRANGATYRPHPSETDKVSRAVHALWRRRGIRVDTAGGPLSDLSSPVVSVFSTGVLEAAARGLPAWVDYPNPPAWLSEFWQRYAMARWGGAPTAAPLPPEREPAAAVAERLRQLAGLPS